MSLLIMQKLGSLSNKKIMIAQLVGWAMGLPKRRDPCSFRISPAKRIKRGLLFPLNLQMVETRIPLSILPHRPCDA